MAGFALLILYQRGHGGGRFWWPGALHGGLGALGVAAFVSALWFRPREDPRHFGMVAMVSLGLALIAGGWIGLARLRVQRTGPNVLALHIIAAAAGLVMLAAYAAD